MQIKILRKRIPESTKKQNLNLLLHQQLSSQQLHYIYNYLQSIYIVLGIISNLEMI